VFEVDEAGKAQSGNASPDASSQAKLGLPAGVSEEDRGLYELLFEYDRRFIKGQPKIKDRLRERICTPLALHVKV